jgi:hypothetical protein
MRIRALLLTLLLLGVPALPGMPGAGSAQAQGQLVEKVARVEVPVYEDNLDDAKSRAIVQGQQLALRSLIEELVAPEWVTLYDKELRKEVLSHLERYIASYRVQKLETSVDRTRFLVVLSAQVNRAQLSEDLRDLNLPVQGDPPTSVTLFYGADDPVLGSPALRSVVEDRLRARLTLLNFRVGALVPLRGEAEQELAEPLAHIPERARLLGRYPSSTALYIAFTPAPAPAAGAPADVGAKASAVLYQKATGDVLATFEQQERSSPLRLPVRTGAERDQLMARLVSPLVIQMQPGAIQAARLTAGKAAELRIRVTGFRSVEDEELFEQAFFKRNSPFERFALYGLGARDVIYQGPYSGDRSTLESDLRGKDIGEFRVRHADWYNDVLELDVQRTEQPAHADLKLFPKELRTPEVSALIDDFLSRFSQLEIEDPLYSESEDNGWLSRADRLAFNATIYGYVDSRSDSDFYVGEALGSGETVTLIWQRIGRTNLTPAIRLYDENGVLQATFTPKTFLRYEYTLPRGQHRFYLEVADRFGYLKVDTGGYLNFHYLFKVQRKAP